MTIDSVFKDYNLYVYNFALKLSCHPSLAEDLTQETFIKAWQKLDTLQNPSAIKAWLRQICLNEFLMHNRKTSATPLTDDELSLLEQDSNLLSNSLPSPEEEVLVDESIRELQNGCFLAMVRRLTLNQRLAFSLIDMFGLSLQETAELMEVSEKATKGLLYRARMNLDAFFHDHCNLLNVDNPCSCTAWMEFSKSRASHQKAIQQVKLVDHVDYTEKQYIFNAKTRAQIYYLYQNMPDKKPSEAWYQKVISLLQTRNIPN